MRSIDSLNDNSEKRSYCYILLLHRSRHVLMNEMIEIRLLFEQDEVLKFNSIWILVFRISFWCNHLACIVLICAYVSVFRNLEENSYYSPFHPLFFGSCLWHSGWSVLNYDPLDLCRDLIREMMYFPSWWSTCSYGWVIARDGGMILMSVCALLGLRYALIVDEPSAYQSMTVWYNDSQRTYVPPRYTPGRQWRRRRMGKVQYIVRRFIVVKGIYTERQTIRYLRRHLMGRMV